MYEEWIAASDNPDKTGERISLVQVKVDHMEEGQVVVPQRGQARAGCAGAAPTLARGGFYHFIDGPK